MSFDESLEKYIAAIYRYLYKNPGVHRNILRKDLVFEGKISKTKFPATLAGLIELGAVKLDKENLTINPEMITLGALRKDNDGYYVATLSSKKRIAVNKDVAANYELGSLLDVIVKYQPEGGSAIILGLSQKARDNSKDAKNNSAQNSALLENKKSDQSLNKTLDVQQSKSQNESEKHLIIEDDSLLLGRVVKLYYDELVFIPNKKSVSQRQIPILNGAEQYSSLQDKICILKLTNPENPALGGMVVEVKGDAGNPIHEYDAIAESYGAIMNWKGEALEKEIEKVPTSVEIDETKLISEKEALHKQRGHIVDLRHLPFVTVDPADCKDMDDAIYSTFDDDGNVICYTAVANVTKYVDLNSEIGKKYLEGGFTIYAPNKAYNILPSKLSTGICSLNPNEDRLAFVMKTVINPETGEVVSDTIYDAVIRSRHKYSYEQAQEIIDDINFGDANIDLMYKTIQGEELSDEEQLLMNYYAAQFIKVGFDKRKMLHFDANHDRQIVFDNNLQDVVDIKVLPELPYNGVIEAFMITANETAAKFALDHHIDNIYRVHEPPSSMKIDRANEFFDLMGISFDGNLSVEGTKALLELVKNTKDQEIINDFLIRAQSRAVYSDRLFNNRPNEEVNFYNEPLISHHGLQSQHYSHTSAIIRRVPDYVTQYNILAYLHGTEPIPLGVIQDIVEDVNEKQIDVDQAEKDFADISNVIYCEKHIGEKFKGRIIKFRQSLMEEEFGEELIVVVKNEEKGITVEIPLSQVIGRKSFDCVLTRQHCAVLDSRGNVLVTLSKPIDFIVERADRKTMTVFGKTNKEFVHDAEVREAANNARRTNRSYLNKKHQAEQYKKPNSRKKLNPSKKLKKSVYPKRHEKYKPNYEGENDFE